MNKPKIVEMLDNNGQHSHWELMDLDTGKILWSETSPENEFIEIEGHKFRRGDIYDIYECERDKDRFLNREAGFIVKTFGDKDNSPQLFKFSESIAYDSYPHEISSKKDKWIQRMDKAISLWINRTNNIMKKSVF